MGDLIKLSDYKAKKANPDAPAAVKFADAHKKVVESIARINDLLKSVKASEK
jgi:hypothetical protein